MVDSTPLPTAPTSSEIPSGKPRGLRALTRLVTDYTGFLDDYIKTDEPPFYYLAVWIAGIVVVLNRFDHGAAMGSEYPIASWLGVWGAALLGGMVFGPLAYFVAGSIFHFRVLLCWGYRRHKVSRLIWLYSTWPLFVGSIIVTTLAMVVYGDDYFTGPTDSTLDLITIAVFILCLAYSAYLSYRGVVRTQEGNRVGAFFLFVVAPGIFYGILVGISFWYGPSNQSEAVDLSNQGMEYYQAGELDKAERSFQQALDKTSNDAPETVRSSLVGLAYVYEAVADTVKAIDCYRQALESVNPDQADYFTLRGQLAILEDDVFRAIDWFKRALEKDPENFDAHNNLGLIYMGEVDETIEDYPAALPHNQFAYDQSRNFVTHQNLAVNLYFVEEYESALDHFHTINREYPGKAIVKLFLGLTEYMQGDLSAAQRHLRQAVDLDSSYHSDFVDEIISGE